MKVLVLGGDGFIGSHLVDKALSLGHEITVFDRFPNRVSMNLEHQRGKIRFFSGEFANRDTLLKSLEGQEVVYHFICATTPVDSWNDPLIEIEHNLKNSIEFFKLAASQGVRKIVFPSSGGTLYGPQKKSVDESSVPGPRSPYGISKLAIEHFLHYFQEHSGIKSDIFRIGNAYGPRQSIHRPQGVIAVWMRDILQGSEIQVYGDQTTLRDYIFIEDVAFLMTNSLLDPDSSDVYNIGSGIGTSIIQLLEIFKEFIDTPFRYQVHPRRSSDNASIILNSSKLAAHFPGFTYQNLESKIPETWDYFKSRYNKKSAITNPWLNPQTPKERNICLQQRSGPNNSSADYFDKYAGSYERVLDSSLKFSGEKSDYFDLYKINFLKRWFPGLDQAVDILDFGCGMGRISRLIAQTYHRSRVYGYDPSQKSIDFAREKWSAAENLKFESSLSDVSEFDLIVIANVFHHIRPQDRRELLTLLKSLLKPEGKIVVFEHNPINPLTRYTMKTCPMDNDSQPIFPYQFVKLVRSCGFNIYLKRYIVFFPKALRFFRKFEPFMGHIPLGAQYTLILE